MAAFFVLRVASSVVCASPKCLTQHATRNTQLAFKPLARYFSANKQPIKIMATPCYHPSIEGAQHGVKIVPMFWGVAFGWELATGYPWGFWKGGDYDLIKEGQERFVKKTAKLRRHAKSLGIYLAHEIHGGTAAMTADDFNLLVEIC